MKLFMKTYGNNNLFHQNLTVNQYIFYHLRYAYEIVAEIAGKIFYCIVHNWVDVMGYAVIKHIPAICYIR